MDRYEIAQGGGCGSYFAARLRNLTQTVRKDSLSSIVAVRSAKRGLVEEFPCGSCLSGKFPGEFGGKNFPNLGKLWTLALGRVESIIEKNRKESLAQFRINEWKGNTLMIAQISPVECRNGAETDLARTVPSLQSILSTAERHELQQLEKAVCNGLSTFIQVGLALSSIRDKRLYRENHDTFEKYYETRWDIKRSHAYRFLNAAKVHVVLSASSDRLPENEAQVRPLTLLPPEKVKPTWHKIIKKAPHQKITAALISQVVNEELDRKKSTRAPQESWQRIARKELSSALKAALKGERDTVLKLLEKIKVILQVTDVRSGRDETPDE